MQTLLRKTRLPLQDKEGAENDAVEISPLVTFAGEGLEEYNGKLMKTPVTIGQCTTQNGH